MHQGILTLSKKSDLPFGSEFSPSQIDLPDILTIIEVSEGSPKTLDKAILDRYFSQHGRSEGDEYNRGKLASNCRLGLIAYQIVDNQARFTVFGKTLLSIRHDEQALYSTLAKHILLNLNGMNLIQCVLDMTAAGEEVTLTTLRQGLALRGVHYPSGGKHPSIMRLWLAKAGIFLGGRWQINELRLRDVLGIDPDQFEILADLSAEQRAFVRALANTGVESPQPANEIARMASAIYGVTFPEKSLPKRVLDALISAGYITAEKTTSGRGAKPFLVAPTPKLVTEIIDPLLEQLINQTDPKLRRLLKKPLEGILAEIQSEDRHISGLALEALAFKLMRLLDMEYLATRLRGSATGGAEVDLIFHSARLVYSRWQIQCKNTARVSLDDVAKEVGLSQFLKTNVIVIVSTGEIGSEARRYANSIMIQTNLAVVMLDGTDIERVTVQPTSIVGIFEREAHAAMRLKHLEI